MEVRDKESGSREKAANEDNSIQTITEAANVLDPAQARTILAEQILPEQARAKEKLERLHSRNAEIRANPPTDASRREFEENCQESRELASRQGALTTIEAYLLVVIGAWKWSDYLDVAAKVHAINESWRSRETRSPGPSVREQREFVASMLESARFASRLEQARRAGLFRRAVEHRSAVRASNSIHGLRHVPRPQPRGREHRSTPRRRSRPNASSRSGSSSSSSESDLDPPPLGGTHPLLYDCLDPIWTRLARERDERIDAYCRGEAV